MDQKTVTAADWMVKAEIKRQKRLERLDKSISKQEQKAKAAKDTIQYFEEQKQSTKNAPLEKPAPFLQKVLGQGAKKAAAAVALSAVLISVALLLQLPPVAAILVMIVVLTTLSFFGMRAFMMSMFNLDDEQFFYDKEAVVPHLFLSVIVSSPAMAITAGLCHLFVSDEGNKILGEQSWPLFAAWGVAMFWVGVFVLKCHRKKKAEQFEEVKESMNLN